MNKTRDDHIIIRDLGFSLLAEGTILKIKANGYSMYPAVKPGSVIYIEPLPDNINPASGDIIAWKRESGFVVHRLVRTERNGNEIIYYTRGDSCKYEDKPVTRDQIAGRVIRLESRKQKNKDAEKLIKKPCYFLNRIIVWLLLRLKRIKNLLFVRRPGSFKNMLLLAIPLWYFMFGIPCIMILCGLQSSDINHHGSPASPPGLTKDFFSYPCYYFFGTCEHYESEI